MKFPGIPVGQSATQFKSLLPNVCGRHHDLVNRWINSVSQMITDILLIFSHNSVLLSSSVTYYQNFNKFYTTVTTSVAGTAYPSEKPNFMREFLMGSSCLNLRLPSSISLSIVMLSLSSRRYIVCSLIFGSCLTHWCIQAFRFPIANGANIYFFLFTDTTYSCWR